MIKIPKAMEAAFDDPQTELERQIKALIVAYNEDLACKMERQVFQQMKRLADAERTLQSKSTKAAAESRRIAVDKIVKARGKLVDLRRADLKPRDSRIFPGSYAPVMVKEDDKRVVKPMRYQRRPVGQQEFAGARRKRLLGSVEPITARAERDVVISTNGYFGWAQGGHRMGICAHRETCAKD